MYGRRLAVAGTSALLILTGCQFHLTLPSYGLDVKNLDKFKDAKGNLVVIYQDEEDRGQALRFIRDFMI